MVAMQALLDVMRRLRDKESGCPWDVQQSFATVAPYTIEEAYEVADAIQRNDLVDLQEELGDLLLQVVFHAQMASEAQQFDFEDVARGIVDKMIRRHPHVFANQRYADRAEQSRAWAAIKSQEKAEKLARKQANGAVLESISSGLADVGRGLPEFQRALRLQAKAAEFGFDWPSITPVIAKLREEVEELAEAVNSGDANHAFEELGDVLFVASNVARHLRVDPGSALRGCNQKFESRFAAMERMARARGLDIHGLDLAALDALWDEAKIDEKAAKAKSAMSQGA